MAFFRREFEWLAFLGAIISFLIAIAVFILLIQKKKERKTDLITYLLFAIFFLAFAPFFDFSLFTAARLDNTLDQQYRIISLSSVLSFVANALANLFFLRFTESTFFEKGEKSFLWLYILQGLVIPGVLLSHFMMIDTLYMLLLHVFSALVIYSTLASNAFKLRRRVKGNDSSDIVSRKGLYFVGLSGILLISAIVMFVLHEILVIVEIREYITVAAGWVLGSISAITIYIGYITPDWIKNRWIAAKK